MLIESVHAIAKAASSEGLLKELYGDLAKPGVVQVGTALATILGLGNTVLWPIQLLNERARVALVVNLEQFRKKLVAMPEEKVAAVPPEVGVPIVEKLSYVTDVDLRELYGNLLAKASNTDTQSEAHPSFVNVINNLSPDEAQLLKHFRRQKNVAFVSAAFHDGTKRHTWEVEEMYFELDEDIKLMFPANIPAYISNLEGLGLLRISKVDFPVVERWYESIEAHLHERFKDTSRPPNYPEFSTERGRISVTKYGWLFLHACTE